MVARTPPKHKKMVAPLNPVLLRETVKKVDRCMARLQELQYTVAGGTKVVSGVSLSPRSTRGYLRTSLRCKQESIRLKNAAPRKSPVGKFPADTGGEWRRMSLPAMLVGETVGEILQASQFAREIVSVVSNKTKKTSSDDPKTPVTEQRKQRPYAEDTELKAKRRKEKQNKLQSIRSESISPTLQRARSRINFKISPPNKRELEKENSRYVANRVSPKHRPWAKKTVLFPNPLFLSTPSAQQQKFCKTRSPVIARNKQPPQTPHKFLIKSPTSASKFQVKIKSPPLVSRSPPTRATSLSLSKKSSPTRIKIKSPPLVSRSPPKRATGLGKKSPKMSTASKLRRSFSPSRLATRLVSPLKSRKSVQKSESLVSGLRQRPTSSIPMGLSARRI
ncbi:microtubule-binding protein TANGLED [Ziziphus jujuba]|uniref:Microtubule-binding protein TANGLED n=1 Tax=Ziziphus jujuba TaxID=326968 RepID=A0A6P3ZNK0_ZIZJJ|nr:microtubule-binding protein TANGLED [Ziziphus jujuba]